MSKSKENVRRATQSLARHCGQSITLQCQTESTHSPPEDWVQMSPCWWGTQQMVANQTHSIVVTARHSLVRHCAQLNAIDCKSQVNTCVTEDWVQMSPCWWKTHDAIEHKRHTIVKTTRHSLVRGRGIANIFHNCEVSTRGTHSQHATRINTTPPSKS